MFVLLPFSNADIDGIGLPFNFENCLSVKCNTSFLKYLHINPKSLFNILFTSLKIKAVVKTALNTYYKSNQVTE